MKFLRNLIFIAVAVIGLSMTASAQKNDPKPRPPKDKPPVINPGQKPPKGNPPKNDDKPKKPEMSWFFVSNRSEESSA